MIKKQCLEYVNRVFVSYEDGVIRTASPEFYKCHETYNKCAALTKPLSQIPKEGVALRVALWHGMVVTQIEAMIEKNWETIYRIEELPNNLSCYAKQEVGQTVAAKDVSPVPELERLRARIKKRFEKGEISDAEYKNALKLIADVERWVK